MSNKVVAFINALIEKADPEVTLKLVNIVYSKRHRHEICVMQLVGKNTFPKMTTEDILNNPKARRGLSVEDAIAIAKLDSVIKERENQQKVLEIDQNGSILLEDHFGNVKRYSERLVSSNREMIKGLSSLDAHDLGYRVGFREGLAVKKLKLRAKKLLKSKVVNLIPKMTRKN